MRTTVDIDDNLYREAKILAATRGVHLRVLFEEGLRRVVAEPEKKPGHRVEFPIIRSANPGWMTAEYVREAIAAAELEDDLHRAGLE